tara:strand:- start:206 stop:439 length:234 start_codon:yes stop_codon:yes gene_type:complete
MIWIPLIIYGIGVIGMFIIYVRSEEFKYSVRNDKEGDWFGKLILICVLWFIVLSGMGLNVLRKKLIKYYDKKEEESK